MPSIFGRHPLAPKHMAQVTFAGSADDLDAATVFIGHARNGPRKLIIKARPAAAAVELAIGSVKWRITPPTDVGPRSVKVIVLADVGPLGRFVNDDLSLFVCQLVPCHAL